LNELQALAIKKSYPDPHAGRRKPIITIGDLQQGHLTTTPKRGGIKGDPKRVKFTAIV